MRHTLLTLALATVGAGVSFASNPAVHLVHKGESGATIARTYGLSVRQLQVLNPRLNLAKLSIGMKINLPGTPSARVAQAAPKLARNIQVSTPAVDQELPPVLAVPSTPALGPTHFPHLERMLPSTVRLSSPQALNAMLEGGVVNSSPALLATQLKPVLSPLTEEEIAPTHLPAFEPADPNNLDLLWPVQTRSISSSWGPRMRSKTVRVKNNRKKRVRYRGRHRGVDLTAAIGTDVYAAQDGQVIASGKHRQYGNYIVVDHGNGVTTLYAHHRVNLVKEGEIVRRGEKIAEVGRTGNSTGPHLHFELRIAGVHQNPLPLLNDVEEIPADLVAQNAGRR